MVNHFEFHHEITTKDLLFKNTKAYAELNKFNIFDHIPLTFIISVDASSYSSDLGKFAQCFDMIEGITRAGDRTVPDYCKQCLKLINQKLGQIKLPGERRAVAQCKAKIVNTNYCGKNIWILKPTGFNRGRGVSVFNSMEKLKNLINFYAGENELPKQKEEKEDPVQNMLMSVKSRTFVIQKYIERPLLIHGRKFDIRAWVLVNHEMKVFFFKEGYIRTSSAVYSLEDESLDKVNVHLTNNAVQKYCQEYGSFEDGNQLSFSTFQVNSKFDNRNT